MMLMYYNTEADSYQPDEDVKVKMSYVLNELKSVVQSGGHKNERGNAYQKFGHVIDSSWQHQAKPQPMPREKAPEPSSRRKYIAFFFCWFCVGRILFPLLSIFK